LIGFSKGDNRFTNRQATVACLRTTKEIAQEIGISEKSMKNRMQVARNSDEFQTATVAELGYLKGGDRKSDEFQKLTVGLRSTKEIAHDIDRG